jgi:hypothetical protein
LPALKSGRDVRLERKRAASDMQGSGCFRYYFYSKLY